MRFMIYYIFLACAFCFACETGSLVESEKYFYKNGNLEKTRSINRVERWSIDSVYTPNEKPWFVLHTDLFSGVETGIIYDENGKAYELSQSLGNRPHGWKISNLNDPDSTHYRFYTEGEETCSFYLEN